MSPLLTFVPAAERFICDDCEYKCLAFNNVHTKKHTLVRVVEKVVETVISTEERLRIVEGHLESVQQMMEVILSKLMGKSTEGSADEAITRGDIRAMVEELKNPEPDKQEVETGDQGDTSADK